jgi:hypothetical protein
MNSYADFYFSYGWIIVAILAFPLGFLLSLLEKPWIDRLGITVFLALNGFAFWIRYF